MDYYYYTFIAFGLFGELGDVDEVFTFLGGGHGGSATFSLLSLSRSRNFLCVCALCCVVGISKLREGRVWLWRDRARRQGLVVGEGVFPRALRGMFLTRLSFGDEWGVSDCHGGGSAVGLGGRQIEWRLVGIEFQIHFFE